MQNLILSFEIILPVFFLMLLGYLLKKSNMLDEHTLKKMNTIIFRVFLSTLLFFNIYNTQLKSAFNPKLMIFGIVSVIVIFATTLIIICLIEKDNKRRGVLIQGIFRSNFVLFGLPVVFAIYGQDSMGPTSLLIAVIVPLYNILAVIVLESFRGSKVDFKRIIIGISKNPLIIASVLGLLSLILGIKFPKPINTLLTDVSKIATPLALIILGGSMNFQTIGNNLKYILMGVFGKLVVVPTIFLGIAISLGFRNAELAILMSMFASPTAVSSFTMAQQMDGDADLAAQLVVFSTTLSVITIFLWIFILKQLGLMI